MTKKICFNMSNLHFGGAIQVASSFLAELVDLYELLNDVEVSLYISTEVFKNSMSSISFLNEFFDVKVFDVFGLQTVFVSNLRKKFDGFDVVFTLFGPDYLVFNKSKRIVGFAVPWIIYHEESLYRRIGFVESSKLKLSFFLKKFFFKGADRYVVELEHVRNGLIRKNIASAEEISIVYNSLSNHYYAEKVFSLSKRNNSNVFKLGVITRNYPHKNLSIIPVVKRILKDVYAIDSIFYVTFTEDEFDKCSVDFKSSVVNLGPKKVEDCPETYKMFDAVFFPTLLECFSATPLEAMAVGKALFASDKAFNRDICGKYAYYFDSLEPLSAASTINFYYHNKWGCDQDERLSARLHALSFSNAKMRAKQYIELLRKV